MLVIVSITAIRSRETLGRAIHERRRALRLTQVDVASVAGVARGVIQKLESGRGTVTIDSALAVLTSLSLDLRLVPRESAEGG